MTSASTGSSSCYNLFCGAVVEGAADQCPRCGGRMKTSASIRRIGWLLVVLGLFVAATIAYVMKEIGPALHEAATGTALPGTDGEFTGTAEQAADTMRLFWALIGFGGLNILNGVFQIVTGKRSRVATVVIFAAAAVIVVLAYGLYQSLAAHT